MKRHSHLILPDIIAVEDIQCVYESSGASFINVHDRKIKKYTPLKDAVKDRHQCKECYNQKINFTAKDKKKAVR